jgi:hypothetical protein
MKYFNEKSLIRVVTCVYCGEAFPQGTPTYGVAVLTEHIKVCPKHPMRKAEADVTSARDALKRLRKVVDLLNGTLKDTERVLFDPEVAAAIKHRSMVGVDHTFACNELLTNLAKLKAAKPKRAATLKSAGVK